MFHGTACAARHDEKNDDTIAARIRSSIAARNSASVPPYDQPATPMRAGSTSGWTSSTSSARRRSNRFCVSGLTPVITAHTSGQSQSKWCCRTSDAESEVSRRGSILSARSPKPRRSGASTTSPRRTSWRA
ncbi:MAG: hypothetical protein KatS3mg010_0906 [Acidimicrobiia bacterium]|nr:MAG: hypothetical protein KatS3mg010_0906 [Acidimicrobiia bacterium]